MNIRMDFLRDKAGNLPETPGVYIMKNSKNEIIYIGKAKILKRRVSQYFQNSVKYIKVEKMVENVNDFDYILTDTETEALILEASLIKQHMPKYNVLLKDDKGYHYFKITNEAYPRIELAHKTENDKSRYIGPYYSSFIVSQTVEETRKMFKIPSCKRSFDKKTRPCLNYHIGLCSAPCGHKISRNEYKENIEDAISYIKNGAVESVRQLTEKMTEASENLEYEKAAKLRDKISAIKKMREAQKIFLQTVKNADIVAWIIMDDKICFDILRFKNGKLYDSNFYIYKDFTDEDEALTDFLIQYYQNNEIPPLIDALKDFSGKDALQEVLSEKRQKRVKISVPVYGEQRKLCEMCERNAIEHLTEKSAVKYKNQKAVVELKQLLGLSSEPHRIEAYDISNTAGSENVGTMVVYKNGQKSRQHYRKFKIKSFLGQDDYKSLAEILERRFNEYEKGTDKSFSELPDLILMDGGKGQLSVAINTVNKFSLDIPVFGMVKDDKHRTKAIVSEQGEVELKATRSAFTFVTEIQDEVHRFSITFHRERRKKTAIESSLLSVDGVGEKRAGILFSHFKTYKAISEATVEELAKVKGIDRETANNIYNFFNMQKN